MGETKYFVTLDNRTIAENMELECALILVKAVFREYHNDHSMVLAVEEMQREETPAGYATVKRREKHE